MAELPHGQGGRVCPVREAPGTKHTRSGNSHDSGDAKCRWVSRWWPKQGKVLTDVDAVGDKTGKGAAGVRAPTARGE